MKKGEKAMLTCKPEYAYGARGSPPNEVAPEAGEVAFSMVLAEVEVQVGDPAGVRVVGDGRELFKSNCQQEVLVLENLIADGLVRGVTFRLHFVVPVGAHPVVEGGRLRPKLRDVFVATCGNDLPVPA